MEKVTFWQMFSQIPVRLAELLVKLISVKGVVLGLATWFQLKGVFDPWVTLSVFAIVVFGREAFKLVSQLKNG